MAPHGSLVRYSAKGDLAAGIAILATSFFGLLYKAVTG